MGESFSMAMAQVYLNNEPIGSFRTQGRHAGNINAVGEDYEVTCQSPTSSTAFIAQQSIDRDPKTSMEGRWYNLEKTDLSQSVPYCV